MRNESLSQFFGLSRAAWLVLPRVTMEHMPNKWQEKMAKLLEEHSETFPNQSDLSFHISAKAAGKFVKLPKHLCNYRHPDREAIDAMKGDQHDQNE